MSIQFGYRDSSYRSVALESITRWEGDCIDCGDLFTFTSPGTYEVPRYPVRRCQASRKKRRREAKLRVEERARRSN